MGGRGAGKSWVGAYDLIRRARRDRLYMVASPTYTVLSDTTFRTFQKIARDIGVLDPAGVHRHPPSIKLTTGAEVIFRSADDPEKLRGPNLSGAWLDEASLMSREAYDILIACLREAGEQGWLSATFTPKGLGHWTYDVFGRSTPDTAIFRARTGDNPFNPKGFEDTLAQQYPGMLARQELGGEFCNVEGAEWPAEYFLDEIFFADWPSPKDITLKVVALDPSKGKGTKYGDFSAFVAIALTRDGVLWCDADLDNTRDAQRIAADGVEMCRSFQPECLILETNGFQELLKIPLELEMHRQGVSYPIHAIENMVDKRVRIRRLGFYLAEKKMRFKGGSKGTKILVGQLKDFPNGLHDDGPDALEMALRVLIEMFNGRPSRSEQVKRWRV